MNQEKIGAQLKAGIIDESVVDASVMRILTTMYASAACPLRLWVQSMVVVWIIDMV
eukprot:COSAG02_NODE_222_length_28382_cov_82.417601_17_plen_56_part_00